MVGTDAAGPGINLGLIDQAAGGDVCIGLGDHRGFPGKALALGFGLGGGRLGGVAVQRVHGVQGNPSDGWLPGLAISPWEWGRSA